MKALKTIVKWLLISTAVGVVGLVILAMVVPTPSTTPAIVAAVILAIVIIKMRKHRRDRALRAAQPAPLADDGHHNGAAAPEVGSDPAHRWRYVTPLVDELVLGMPLATNLAVEAEISYRDSQSAPSRRRVTIQHVFTHGVGPRSYDRAGYIKGWCHLAKAERTFNIDRIVELVDPETGEVAKQPVKWIEQACGITVPLAPFRRVHLEPTPPPVTLTWQRGPHDLEMYDLRIDEVQTVDGNPVLISGRGRRLSGGRRRAASGSYSFELTPLQEDLARPIAIRWREDKADAPDVVGWVRHLLEADAGTGFP